MAHTMRNGAFASIASGASNDASLAAPAGMYSGKTATHRRHSKIRLSVHKEDNATIVAVQHCGRIQKLKTEGLSY